MRTGILSDAAHAKNCAKYQPIPMKEAERILKVPKIENVSKFSSKPAKYKANVIRPANFDTLAQTLARIGDSATLRDALDDTYTKDLSKITNILNETGEVNLTLPSRPNTRAFVRDIAQQRTDFLARVEGIPYDDLNREDKILLDHHNRQTVVEAVNGK